MALDDLIDLIANATRTLDRRQINTDETVASLRARIDALVDVLAAKDILTDFHRKHLDRVARNGSDERPRVRLRTHDPDKYNMHHGEPVDCAARLPLCKARCCTFTVVLSEQDLAEGKVAWDYQEPYVLRRGKDGRCVYLDRATGGCNNYEHRPATCRSYSCKDDRRIWLDFENRIPAPPPMLDADNELTPET